MPLLSEVSEPFVVFFLFYLLTYPMHIQTYLHIYIYFSTFQQTPQRSRVRSRSLSLSLSIAHMLCVSRAAFLQLIHLSAAWKICTGIALRSASAMMNRSVSLNLHVQYLCSYPTSQYPLVCSRALSLSPALALSLLTTLGDSGWCMFTYVER